LTVGNESKQSFRDTIYIGQSHLQLVVLERASEVLQRSPVYIEFDRFKFSDYGIQDPRSESGIFWTRCQKTEFGTYGDVGNVRRRKKEVTSKIEMDRWDSRRQRHEY